MDSFHHLSPDQRAVAPPMDQPDDQGSNMFVKTRASIVWNKVKRAGWFIMEIVILAILERVGSNGLQYVKKAREAQYFSWCANLIVKLMYRTLKLS